MGYTPQAVERTRNASLIPDLATDGQAFLVERIGCRIITPLKGDAASVPINDAARKIVDAWDPAKDEAAGLQCKSYGAPAIMRVPGRLHITWQDENTLKIDTDSGTQTRLFHFAGTPPKEIRPSWQGYSAARSRHEQTQPLMLASGKLYDGRSRCAELAIRGRHVPVGV